MAENKKLFKIVETVLRECPSVFELQRGTSTSRCFQSWTRWTRLATHTCKRVWAPVISTFPCVSKGRSMETTRSLRDGFKNTKLQMLFRGQNIWIQPLLYMM